MTAPDETGNGPVIRDNRRIDPDTGQVRRGKHAASSPAGTTGAGRPGPAGPRHGRGGGNAPGAEPGADVSDAAESGDAGPGAAGDTEAAALRTQLAERTADLQRLQAEYAN